MLLRNLTVIVGATMLFVGCETSTEPTDSVSVRIENAAISAIQGSTPTLIADARLINESSVTITPYLCATVKVERQVSPGEFVDVTASIECASTSSTTVGIAPHSEAVIRLAVPLNGVASAESTYRVRFPVFVEGEKNSRIVTSDSFDL
jgi:hypothetical protein